MLFEHGPDDVSRVSELSSAAGLAPIGALTQISREGILCVVSQVAAEHTAPPPQGNAYVTIQYVPLQSEGANKA